MDNFKPYGDEFQEYLSNLGKLLRRCIEMHLSLSPENCEFLKKVGVVLIHSISQAAIQVDPNKITIIKRALTPQKQKDVRSFLGLVGYYRRFIKYFSKIASPLFGLLAKDSEFIWSSPCQEAFKLIKKQMNTTPILRGPNWTLPFHIHIDASKKVVGATLEHLCHLFHQQEFVKGRAKLYY